MTKDSFSYRGEMVLQHSCVPTRAAELNVSGYAYGPPTVVRTI